MIAFPSMLLKPCEEAGIEIPPEYKVKEDTKEDPEFDGKQFPHFAAFMNYQLGRPMPEPTSHWDNAKKIARIPKAKILKMTMKDLVYYMDTH